MRSHRGYLDVVRQYIPHTLNQIDNVFHATEDLVAKVICNLAEPAQDPKTRQLYCDVELHFHVAMFEVKCCKYHQIHQDFEDP
jgi:hypothetical protein